MKLLSLPFSSFAVVAVCIFGTGAARADGPPAIAPAEPATPPPLPPPTTSADAAPVPQASAATPSASAPVVVAPAAPPPPPAAAHAADDETPKRQGFTIGLGLGAAFTSVSPDQGDSVAKFGLAPLSFEIGAFVSPAVAILFRGAGTSYFEEGATSRSALSISGGKELVQFTHAIYGVHAQYWFSDQLMVSGGPGAYIFGPNPFSTSDVKPVVGYGASARIGYAVKAITHHAFRVSFEVFPAKYEKASIFGTALNLEWQYY